MKKFYSLFFIILFISNFIFAEDYSYLFDEAKKQYKEGHYEASLNILSDINKKITQLEQTSKKDDYEEVSFTQLHNFPKKYIDKKIRLSGVAISSSNLTDVVLDNKYACYVFSLNQSSSFPTYFFDDKLSLVFVLSEELVEKLIETIPAGMVGYFEICTDKIYEYQSPSKYISDKKTPVLLAEIVSLESLTYNQYTNLTYKTGDFLIKTK